MTVDSFVNKLIDNGWLLKEMKNRNMVFNRPYSDDNGASRETPDYDYPQITIEFDQGNVFVTILHDKFEVLPKINRRPVSDFLENENDDTSITCTWEIRGDMMTFWKSFKTN